MAKTVLEEFVTILGLDVDTEEGKEYKKVLDDVNKAMKRVVGLATAAAAAVGIYTRSVSRSTDENFKFANSIGVSFEGMQRLTGAMQIYGASAETTRGVLANMSEIISGLPFGRGPLSDLAMLGVDPHGKTPEQLFEDIFKALESRPKSQRLALGAPLGFGLETLNAIDNGWERINEQVRLYREIGAEKNNAQGLMSEEFEDRVLAVGWAFESIGNTVAFKLQPVFNRFAGDFVEWFIAAKESGAIARGFDLMAKALRPLAIMLGIIAGIMTVGFIAANSTIILITAGLAGLALVADELIAVWNSEDGLFFRATQGFMEIVEWLRKAKDGFADLVDVSSKFSLGDVGGFFSGALDNIKDFVIDGGFSDRMAHQPPLVTSTTTATLNAPISVAGLPDVALLRMAFKDSVDEMLEMANSASRNRVKK